MKPASKAAENSVTKSEDYRPALPSDIGVGDAAGPMAWADADVLAAIMESSDDAIISKDLNGIIRSWNRGAEHIFGYTAEEAIGKPVLMLAVPERVDEIPNIIERIRRGEKVDHYRTQRQTKDGRVLDISLTVSPVRDATGTIIGASKVARDITEERRRTELQERLAAIVESSDDAIISKDLNGIILSWNKGAERIFGYTAEEAIGKPVSMLAVPERVEEISNIIGRIRRGERIDHYETKRKTKDGRVLDISLTVSPIRNAAREVVGASKIARDITERRRLEEAVKEHSRHLAARERYLQAVLESMPECIKVLGPDGQLKEMNRAGLRMVEADRPEDVIGACVYPLIDEDYREAFREINESVFRGGTGGTLQFAITGLKGSHRFFETNVVSLRNEDDVVIGALSATRDITDWKHAEQALRASEARFRAAVSAVSSIIWTNDSEGRMTGEQPGWTAFTGQSKEEVQGYGWATAVHPEDAQSTIDAWNESVRERRPFIFEHRVRRYDGAYRLFSIRAVPVFDDAGTIREWVGVHTDITEERALTESRTVALQREHEARQTAELLNKVGPLLAAELDTQSLTQKVTDLATQLVGAQFGALFHNVQNEQGESYTLYTISGVPREHFSRFPMPRKTKVFAPTFAGHGVVRSEDITKDHRYGQNPPYAGMPEGHLPVRSYIAVPVVSRSGEVLGGLFFGHELASVFTEQHEALLTGIAAQAAIALDNARLFSESIRAREALARSNDELRRANADLEQFAYSASHDLKEPLRMVAIYSQILQRKYGQKLDVNANEYLRTVLTGAQRMDKLVHDLLAYTRSSAPADSSEPISSVDAEAVFEQAVTNLSQSIEESGATIEKGALPPLRVMEVHLLQLFQNLIENAIKYRGNTPPQIRVQATREKEQDLWRICVDDNGIGIAPEYRDQVFGIFKRLHPSEHYSGTGIGLAICQRLVLRYGGRIWVESEGEGKGSTFCFTLPGGELKS
jgi:PAS domain S-box-containing protein